MWSLLGEDFCTGIKQCVHSLKKAFLMDFLWRTCAGPEGKPWQEATPPPPSQATSHWISTEPDISPSQWLINLYVTNLKKNPDRHNVYFPNEASRCNWELECRRECIHQSVKLSCSPAVDYVKCYSCRMHCFHLTDKNIAKCTFHAKCQRNLPVI